MLIWQKTSPAPYESAWSLFVKVLALNAMRPRVVKGLISKSSNKDCHLKFWDSSWVDFQRFSSMLNVDESRLKQCFLDQLEIKLSQSLEIKNCNECLKHGYHCVFFQLPFITHCPWHGLKLSTPCYQCKDAIKNYGLKVLKKLNVVERKSDCQHVHYIDYQGAPNDTLSMIQIFSIEESCQALIEWLRKVSTSLEVFDCLTSISATTSKSLVSMYLFAAESVAGKSPWFIDSHRQEIRTLFWSQPNEKFYYLSESPVATRNSAIDTSYRSVRRYLYKRFIKPHRTCWNGLMNVSYYGAQLLNSKTTCTVSLAYAAWRLSVENFINIEALKTGQFSKRPILILQIPGNHFNSTEHEKCALLYAYFFYIWNDIQSVAGKDRYSIVKDLSFTYAAKFALKYVSGNWCLMFPSYSKLEYQSFTQCIGRLRPPFWMQEKLVRVEASYWREEEGVSTHTMFRLETQDYGTSYSLIEI